MADESSARAGSGSTQPTWDPTSPDVVLDLSDREEGSHNCFLLVYTAEDGSLADLAVVTATAVYKGGRSCVQKPMSKKKLGKDEHLSKVKDALVSAAAKAATAASASNRSPPGAGAEMPLKLTADDAVITVKEAVKGGSSFVVLATVRVPVVKEANGGLLLGVVRAAYRRGNEAERWRRSLERAGKEQAKLKEVLDRAVSEKRKVLHRVLEKAVLVVNAKKAKIADLQEGGTDDQGSGSEETFDHEDETNCSDDDDEEPNPDSKKKGKAESQRSARAARAGRAVQSAESDSGRGVKLGPVEGRSRSRRGGGEVAKVKAELDVDTFGGMEDGRSALAVPMGTQVGLTRRTASEAPLQHGP